MSPRSLTDPTADAVALGSRRAEVLAQLREADQPLSVQEVADRTGLHVNTARFHLDGLVGNDLAERSTEGRDAPGRPRILYSARRRGRGPRSFALLAEMLTGLVSSSDKGSAAAVEAGRAWGRHLVERPAPSQRIDVDEATTRLNDVLDAIGFEPRVEKKGNDVEIGLRHCPFLEVAQRHTDVVCAIHLGLMQGALGELNAPLEAESLEPFVTPTLCRARLRPAGRP